MMNYEIERSATAIVLKEGKLLDDKNWEAWLELYLEDAEYWIPCWRNEHDTTEDPNSEVSLIYYADRAGLEDRVFRIKTGRSLASTPLPRTCHLITPTSVRDLGDSYYEVI